MWDFGDGDTDSGEIVSHTYDDSGDFDVTLTVTDTCGFSKVYVVTEAVTVGGTYIYLPVAVKNY